MKSVKLQPWIGLVAVICAHMALRASADERGTVREVIYKHAKHTDRSELDDITHVRPGMPLDVGLNISACHALQQHLKEQGYYFAKVLLEEGDDESHERVIFNITEGPVLRVRKVEFVGETEFARPDNLRRVLKESYGYSGSGFEFVTGKFQAYPDAGGIAIPLEQYFRSIGFLNVRVSREMDISDDYRFADLVFRICEGTRYRISACQVRNTSVIDRPGATCAHYHVEGGRSR